LDRSVNVEVEFHKRIRTPDEIPVKDLCHELVLIFIYKKTITSNNIMKFNIIVCVDKNNGIGNDGSIPWYISDDLKHFRDITIKAPEGKQNVVIMGRNTWESIPNNFLKNRINIVLSSTLNNDELYIYKSLTEATDAIDNMHNINEVFIIGGEKLYTEAIMSNLCDYIYLTRLSNTFICDSYFPDIPFNYYIESKSELYEHTQSNYEFIKYVRDNRDEMRLNNLITKVLDEGDIRQTRNSIVHSIFGEKLTFDISESFPLMTCKRVWFKGVFEELIWFIRGEVDSNKLSKKGVNIWKGNSTREYLDSIKLNKLPEGNCGCIYGYQWRNFNAPFKGTQERGNGIDQLQKVVDLLRYNPTSRRIFMSAWNPAQMDEMCLPPCHISYQFYVSDGKLSCQMYQRSSDLFLGLYFNIASTALLTYLLAKITGLKPYKIHICIGDAHIYENHIKQCRELLDRNSRPFPILKIKTDIRELCDIENMIYSDIDIIGYKPHPTIQACMY
jgi:dihydrofolate reductase/thymidylate synthase